MLTLSAGQLLSMKLSSTHFLESGTASGDLKHFLTQLQNYVPTKGSVNYFAGSTGEHFSQVILDLGGHA